MLAAAASLMAGSVGAQTPTRQGTAQALFDEAGALFEKGELDTACDKFKASYDLDPKGGTLLNLAICREKQGRIATAWTAFAEARNLAAREGRKERVTFADGRLRQLERALPRMTMTVEETAAELVIRVDGEPLPRAAWGVPVPVDPGPRQIEASAPHHLPFTTTITATRAATVQVTIPVLAPDGTREPNPLVSNTTPPPAPTTPIEESPRWPGWLSIGIGAAGIGIGSVFGITALGQRDDAESLCASGRCDEGRDKNDVAIRNGWVSNIAFGVGIGAVALGVYLLVRSPKSMAQRSATFTF